jgi:hypothetical protein
MFVRLARWMARHGFPMSRVGRGAAQESVLEGDFGIHSV